MCTGLPGPKGLDGLDGLKGQKGFTGTPGTIFQEFMDIFSMCAILKHIEYNTSTGIYHYYFKIKVNHYFRYTKDSG